MVGRNNEKNEITTVSLENIHVLTVRVYKKEDKLIQRLGNIRCI